MRIKSVTTAIFGAALLVAFAAPAMAQAKPAAPAASSTSMSTGDADFGIGYSYLHIDAGSAAGGFDAFYDKDFRSMNMGSLGYVVDFSVNHGNGGTAEFGTGGVRVNFKGNMKAKLYGQATAGFSHFGGGGGGESQLVIDFGGGLNMPIQGKKFGFFAQIDFPVVFFSGASSTGLRLNVGITMPIGK